MKWVSEFATAHTKLFYYNEVTERTCRIILPCNLTGTKIRVKLSNRFGEGEALIGAMTAAICDAKGTLKEETLQVITVGGRDAFGVPAGGDLYTDEVPLAPAAGQYVAVSMYFPAQGRIASGGCIGHYTIRSIPGDYTGAAAFEADPIMVDGEYNGQKFFYEPESPLPVFQSLEVCTQDDVCAAAILGDSITAMDLWVRPFADALYAAYPGRVSCCNLGVSGNCLFHDSPAMFDNAFGIAGVNRFDADVLQLAGVKYCLLLIGTNDLGYPAILPGAAEATIGEFRAAYRSLADRAKEQGIETIALTLLPRQDVMMTPEREQVRQEVNRMLLEEGIFDQVIDLEAVLRGDDGALRPELYADDGLHVSAAGGAKLAEYISYRSMQPRP